MAVGMTKASSGTSSGEMRVRRPPSARACSTIRRPTYGSPPPPVPRKAAPRARSRRSWLVSSLAISSGLHRGAKTLLDRHVIHVVTEVARSDQRQALRSSPFAVARCCDHGDPEAVSELFGGDRLTGFRAENDDEIWHRGDYLAVAYRDEVLVLKTQHQRGAGITLDAVDAGFSLGEAGLGSPLDVGDLAFEDSEAPQPLQNCVHR